MPAIIFLDHAPALGGAEHSLLLLLGHLDRTQWQPHLAGVPGALLQRAQTLGVPTYELELPRLRRSPTAVTHALATARHIAQIAHQTNALALHSNTIRATFYAALASKLGRIPLIWHMRDFWLSENEPQRKGLDSFLKRILCRTAAHVITNSHAVAAHLPPRPNVSVVHNGLDLTHFGGDWAQDGRAFRHQHTIPEEAVVVGMVGRLRPWKGQPEFIQMAAHLRQQGHTNLHFLIVGGSPLPTAEDAQYLAHLHTLIHHHALTPTFTFTGHMGDVRPALAALDIFVHPGQPEPFGLVNIEAMALAKPIVAFAHGALPEIVLHGETGFLVPPADTAQLATYVHQLAQEAPLRHHLGTNGRTRAQTFDIRHTADKVMAIYEKIDRDRR